MFGDGSSAQAIYDGIAISRAETEDVAVQVMLDDGFFHREMDYRTTACDLPIPSLGQWRRPNKYDGNLCKRGCWSKVEIERAEAENLRERNLDHVFTDTGEHAKLDRETGEAKRPPVLPSGLPPRKPR